jgi:isopentenyl-diphosphate delta-isomerase
MSDKINTRKLDHLRAIADDEAIERHGSGFDAVRLTHNGLPELDFAQIDSSVEFLGKQLSMPLVISSMTGGDSEEILNINRNLAIAAEATGIAMAVGSQRVMFANPKAAASFALREFAPNALLLSNIGAVQLNYELNIDHVREAMNVLEADGLYLHLNPLQEAIQPEGDLNFANLSEKIASVANQVDKPVLLKEVGCGLSPRDIEKGLSAGITHFDLAGRGGTSWSRIEYHRRKRQEDEMGLLFQDWGLTTVEALKLAEPYRDRARFVASGGIRSGIDIAKAIILGAHVCGVAAPFLVAAKQSAQAVIDQIEVFRREFKTALFLLGCQNCQTLRNNKSLII